MSTRTVILAPDRAALLRVKQVLGTSERPHRAGHGWFHLPAESDWPLPPAVHAELARLPAALVVYAGGQEVGGLTLFEGGDGQTEVFGLEPFRPAPGQELPGVVETEPSHAVARWSQRHAPAPSDVQQLHLFWARNRGASADWVASALIELLGWKEPQKQSGLPPGCRYLLPWEPLAERLGLEEAASRFFGGAQQEVYAVWDRARLDVPRQTWPLTPAGREAAESEVRRLVLEPLLDAIRLDGRLFWARSSLAGPWTAAALVLQHRLDKGVTVLRVAAEDPYPMKVMSTVPPPGPPLLIYETRAAAQEVAAEVVHGEMAGVWRSIPRSVDTSLRAVVLWTQQQLPPPTDETAT